MASLSRCIQCDQRNFFMRLESVRWKRPGILDVEISELIKLNGEIPAPPSPGKYLGGYKGRFIERRIDRVSGADKVTWLFRAGYEPTAMGAVSGNGDDPNEFWSMDVSLMQVPLTSHSNLDAIIKAGGGQLRQGEIDWPRQLKGKKNPWYGTHSFLFPTVTITKEKIKRAAVFSFASIAGLGDSTSANIGWRVGGSSRKDRAPWIKEGHYFYRAGDSFREKESWRWGGILGWADQLYNPAWGGKK
jgi:hypothetical protein